jgi:hypothetical protein
MSIKRFNPTCAAFGSGLSITQLAPHYAGYGGLTFA